MLKLLHIIRFSFMFETYIILRLQYTYYPDLLIDMMRIIISILTIVLRFNHVRGPLGNYINRCLSDATRDEWLQPSTLI